MATTPPQQPTPPTQPTKKNWPLIILLLTAASGPFAAGIAFAEEVVQHPWQAAGLALLYWFVLGIFGFVTKIWEKLEARWVEKAADWVDMRVQAIFSGYRRRYLQHLRYRHRDFDVKGLSTQGIFTLELERVFVELTIVPRPPHKTSADPIRQIPPELREGRHTIWSYLRSEVLADQGLAVIGPPGSGKTTLLKHMALTLTGDRKLRKRHNAPDKLPILLFLRDHAQTIKDAPNLSLAQAVQDGLTKQGGPQAPPGWFQRQLERGRCLVMLDGLDEVADPDTRKQVVDWVERQMVACSKNRFLVTSRPHGYRTTPLTNVAVLEVAPFDRDQVKRFVDNWYLANEVMSAQKDDPGVRMKAREGADDLLRRIWGSPALTALAVNPLLLTMISNVHRYRSSLPGRRVELYAEICEVFLGKRQAAKGVAEDLTPAQKRRVLQPLAYHLMRKEQREIPLGRAVDVIATTLACVDPNISGVDFLKMIENSSGLLVERESGVYGFAHKTFQEYLASIHIQEAGLKSELLKQVENTWWHEAIRLYCAQADATPVVQACLKEDPPSIPALVLAIECLDEAREVQPKVRAQLESVLNEGVEDEDPERRRIIAEALLSLRLQRMVRVSEDRYVDPTPITHAEYQLFLDEQRAQGKYHQPDHWQDFQFPRRTGRASVVGARPSDAVAFCEWLTQREAGPWRYRLPQVDEVGIEPVASQPDRVPTAVAHWCTAKEDEQVATSAIPLPGLPTELLERRIASDLDRTRVSARILDLANVSARAVVSVLDRASVSTRPHNLDRDLTIARARARASASNLTNAIDLARVLALASARASDLVGAIDRTHTSDRASAIASALDRDLASVIALASARAIDLEIDLDRTIASARASARDLTIASAHASATAIASASARAIDLARTHTRDLARDLASTRTRILNRVSTSAIVSALDRAIDLASISASAIDLAHDLELDLAYDLISAYVSISAIDRALALDCASIGAIDFARTSAIDLARDLANARARVVDFANISSPSEMLGLVRWYTRLEILIVATGLQSYTQSQPVSEHLGFDERRTAAKTTRQSLVDTCLNLYIDLAILEARVRGELPAFEGICIVKERIKDETTNT